MAPTRGCNKHWECKNITFLFLLFYCLVQCRDNGDSCMYTELYIVVLGLEIIAGSINISLNNSLTAAKSSNTVYKMFKSIFQSQAQSLTAVRFRELTGAFSS